MGNRIGALFGVFGWTLFDKTHYKKTKQYEREWQNSKRKREEAKAYRDY